MKVQHVLNCAFSSWFPAFKNLSPQSFIIPLPKQFVDYLKADRVFLPEGSGQIQPKGREDAESDDEDYFDDDYEWNSTHDENRVPDFPELDKKIRSCIEELDGEVFPKLNWSSPKDAFWISFSKTLRCTCPADIYLLLKSSDFVTHDLTSPFEYCEDAECNRPELEYNLILRRWVNIHPGSEFRCFVKNGALLAICQRHDSEYYGFIEQNLESIKTDITTFFKQRIASQFVLKEYVFDVYRKRQGKIVLLDFNPFGPVTDSLMFDWSELLSDHPFQKSSTDVEGSEDVQQLPVFRYIRESESAMKPNPYAYYALPKDFVDLSLGTDPYKLVDFLKLQNSKMKNEESDEEK
ncbi:division cycle 123 homolog [Octopus vulgaris]|uniref:Division cycle 123 homolog n=2 Tax=Octopus TaxID=6643 RepID=A0AA36BA90_OCTVU|nr:cell division cycle protein 123 homolog [Octopus sinensis]CAI9729617.1 division cycle 123 homolog [Octopus vulgaris]